MKRYEIYNQWIEKKHSAQDQAVSMLVSKVVEDIGDNQVNDVQILQKTNEYRKLFAGYLEWLNEEVE